MHPTRLNLLSPEKRTYLRRMIYAQFTKNTLISVIFIFCISGITLLGGQWVLQEYFCDISNNLLSINGRHAEKNKQIKEVNIIISEIDALQEINILWSPTIIRLTNSIPEGIVIDNLSLNSNSNAFIFNGTADTRENLLKMQTNLNNLDFIDSTDIPLSQLTEKENFTFSISATGNF
jgi:hypothetical protein